jgi:hypothetical protein
LSASSILRGPPAPSKATPSNPPDLIGDLSDWSCDTDTCGITSPCDACERRERVAKLLAQRDLERRPCTLDCTPMRPCERCAEVQEYLTWLYTQRDQVAVLLRALRQIARVFPEELRELLAEPVLDIMEEAQK